MADTYLRDFCTWVWARYAKGGLLSAWTSDEVVEYHREFVDQRVDFLGKYKSQELLDALFIYGCTDDQGKNIECDAILGFSTRGPRPIKLKNNM